MRLQAAQAIAFEVALYGLGFVAGCCWFMLFFPMVAVRESADSAGAAVAPGLFIVIWVGVAATMLASVLVRIVAAITVFQGHSFRLPILTDWVEGALGPSAPPSLT